MEEIDVYNIIQSPKARMSIVSNQHYNHFSRQLRAKPYVIKSSFRSLATLQDLEFVYALVHSNICDCHGTLRLRCRLLNLPHERWSPRSLVARTSSDLSCVIRARLLAQSTHPTTLLLSRQAKQANTCTEDVIWVETFRVMHLDTWVCTWITI